MPRSNDPPPRSLRPGVLGDQRGELDRRGADGSGARLSRRRTARDHREKALCGAARDVTLRAALCALAAAAALALLPSSTGGGAAAGTRSDASFAVARTSARHVRPTSVRWLCHPGMRHDPCTADLDATAVSPSGVQTARPAQPAGHPSIDCFYVYPTVSDQQQVNASLAIQPAERAVAVAQASRFSQVCRVYAPMYRQITLYGLAHPTAVTPADVALAYDGVLAAWKRYLARDSHGRAFVLIGHSQGASILIRLVQTQVDRSARLRKRLVSAIVLGGNVTVPTGKDVGGSFLHVPACRSRTQLHCVVAYSSFDEPPPSNSLFGIPGAGVSLLSGTTVSTGRQVLCTNPADLAGGSGSLRPYFPTSSVAPRSVPTPWVTYPDMYRSRCEHRGDATWLQVDDVAPPGDPNPAVSQVLGPQWGLHLVDVNIALGNLVGLVRSEAASSHRQR